MSKKPNIILIFEDHKAFHGHGQQANAPKIHKPNFERLVNEGVEFSQSYTACPLCGPARRTLLTGLYPHSHGEIKNETNEDYLNELYFEKLAEQGYKNYYFGKWHAGAGTALDFGCEGFSLKGYGNPYMTPEYEKYLEQNDLDYIQVKIQKDFKDPISKNLGIKEGDLYEPRFPVHSEYFSAIMTTPKETHEAFFLTSMACDKLKEIAKDENKQPFHMRIDFWGPHEPYITSQEYLDLYDSEKIPQHPNFIDNLDTKPELYRRQNGDLISKDKHLILPNPLPWSEWQKILAINYSEQTLIDEAVGNFLDTLEELGLAENTVVIWAADHGDAVASHGGHFDKDAYMPQEVIRVPLAIRWPDVVSSGQKCDKFVSNVDYPCTFLDIADTKFSNPVHGKSLVPLLENQNIKWKEEQFVETHGHFTTIVGRALITERYKYIYNEGYMDELYDLKEDPYELNNLIDREDYNDILKDMKTRLQSWRDITNDDITFDMIKGKKLNR